MTSYFEIGGHIVECETTSQFSLSGVTSRSQPRIAGSFDARAAYLERPVERTSSSPSTGSTSKQIIQNPYRRMIGSAMIRTGVAILMVPDPLPIIDEVGGAALVYGGIYLHATAE